MNTYELPLARRINRVLFICCSVVALGACSRQVSPEQLLADARAAFERNDLQTASIQLKSALQKNGNNAAARFELGRLYQRVGEGALAANEFTRALDLGYPAGEVVPLLVQALVDSGKANDAVSKFALTHMPDTAAEANLKAALGYAWLATDNVEAATRAFDEAIAIDPHHMNAAVGKARLLGTKHDLAGAQALLDPVLASGKADYQAWFLDAEIKAAQGKFDPAIASYRKVYQIRPDQIRARFIVISAFANEGKLDEARKELSALRKVAPKAPEANYLDGLLLIKERKFAEAREKLNKTLSVAPGYLPAVGLAAVAEFELKSYAQAEQHAEKVIAGGGDSLFIRKVLVGSYLRTGRIAKAEQALAPLLKSQATNPDVQSLAGQVYLAAGNAAAAEAAFALAAKQKPNDPSAQSRLGLSQLAVGDRAAGVRSLETAASLDVDDTRSDIVLILAHLRNRDADHALAAIDVLEKKKPGQPMAQNLRGTAYLLKNDIERARASFMKALEIDPMFFAAVSNLARLDMQAGKPADAEGRFRSLLSKSPTHPDALMALAGLKARTKEGIPDAVGLLQKAIEGNPKVLAPRLSLIELHTASGKNREALAVASDAAAAFPDDMHLLEVLASTQALAGEVDASIATRTKLVTQNPADATMLLRLAAAQVVGKRDSEAIQNVRKALTIQPDLLEAQNMLIAIHRSRNAHDDAVRVIRDVQRQRPKEAVGYVMEGEFLMSNGKADAAIKPYREALAREKTAVNITRLHAALSRSGHERDAQVLVDGWVKDNPKDNAVPMYLADIALSQKRYDDARSRYEAVLARAPDNPVVLNNLAWLAAQNNDAKAMDYAKRAFAVAPRSPAVLDTYGSILVNAGDVERGLQMMRDAVTGAPGIHDLQMNLAKALAKAGRKADARKELESLAALGSSYERAAEVADLMKAL